MFKIDKENVTLTEADFAVDFLHVIKGALFLVLFILFGVSFILLEINFVMIRLVAFLLLTIITTHFILIKYIHVLQEHIEDIK